MPEMKIEQADLITYIFKYPDIEFYFSDANLIEAYTETAGVCASPNVRIASKVSKAISVWGKSHVKIMEDKKYY